MFGRTNTILKVIFITVLIQSLQCSPLPSNITEPDLNSDRIVLKNSIAYHFIKHVRSIEAEIFITRRINISPLAEGIRRLDEARLRLLSFCDTIQVKEPKNSRSHRSNRPQNEPDSREAFTYFPEVGDLSFYEADARCSNLGMQLPEAYDRQTMITLARLMLAHNISAVFAGIKYDPETGLQRFIHTGLAWWQGHTNKAMEEYSKVAKTIDISDDPDTRFLYNSKGMLQITVEKDAPLPTSNRFYKWFRYNYDKLSFATAPLICQSRFVDNYPNITLATGYRTPEFKYDFDKVTNAFDHSRRAIRETQEITIPATQGNSTIKAIRTKRAPSRDPMTRLAKEHCNSIASHIHEIELRSRERLTKLLNLIDISINLNVSGTAKDPQQFPNDSDKNRFKRTPMGLFLLKNGIRSIWSLFGFIEKIRTNRRLNRLEKEVARLQSQNDRTAGMVDYLTLVVSNHSIMINQLQVTTAALTEQVKILNKRVDALETQMEFLNTLFQMEQAMSLLQNVVDRTRDAMTHGFTILEHIVDKALMSETSAHLLPAEQIRKVQVEISIFSNSIMDSEYKRMKSVIVSDPENSECLRAIISVASLSRRNYELVELMPVPLFSKTGALQPVLSHQAAMLDQQEGTFTTLDQREMTSCLRNEHCVTSSPELRTNAVACGIPQFFDWSKNKCEFEPVLSGGIFLKRLGTDGIVFSLQKQVTAQLFCLNIPGQSKTIDGSGILQLPPGCALSITTSSGEITKIKSMPISQVIQAQDLELIVTGPNHIFQTKGLDDLTNTSNSFTRIIGEHLIGIEKQLDETNEDVQHHKNIVIILGAILCFTLVIITVLAALLYRYSSRFRSKVKYVKEEIQGVGERIMAFEREAAARARQAEAPPNIPPRNTDYLIKQLEALEKKAKLNEYLDIAETNPFRSQHPGSTYSNNKHMRYHVCTLPTPKPRNLYPMLPPRSDLYSTSSEYNNRKPEYGERPVDIKSTAPRMDSTDFNEAK